MRTLCFLLILSLMLSSLFACGSQSNTSQQTTTSTFHESSFMLSRDEEIAFADYIKNKLSDLVADELYVSVSEDNLGAIVSVVVNPCIMDYIFGSVVKDAAPAVKNYADINGYTISNIYIIGYQYHDGAADLVYSWNSNDCEIGLLLDSSMTTGLDCTPEQVFTYYSK